MKNPNPSAVPSPSAGDSFLNDTAFVASQIGETDDQNDGLPQPEASMPESVFPPELVETGLKGIFNVLFGMIAEKRGEHWNLKPFEETGLAKAWCPLMQLMLANLGSTEQGMIVMAVMTTGAVVGGKVAADANIRAKKATAQDSSTESTRTPAFAG